MKRTPFQPFMQITFLWAVSPFGSLAYAVSPCEQLVTPCDRTWDATGGPGIWQDPGRWLPDLTTPNWTTGVCIPPGSVVIVSAGSQDDAEALSIRSEGRIIVEEGRKLYVHGDVKINESLTLERNTEFVINENMKYCGREIRGVQSGQGSTAKISGNRMITFQGTGIGQEPQLTVHGHLVITAPVVNNARVVADDGTLTLSGSAKSGGKAGLWAAEFDATKTHYPGRLVVNTAVSGSSKWLLTHHRDAVIEINAKCGKLSGPVEITHGKFIVNPTGSFWTTGSLLFVGGGGSETDLGVPFESEIQVKVSEDGVQQGSAFFGG